MESTATASGRCCTDEATLVVLEVQGSKVVRQCTVCHCKHYEFTVDPLLAGIKLS